MKKFDNLKIIYYTLGAFLVALFLFFSYSRVFDEFEYSMLDFRYKLRPPQAVEKDIVIIEIGDDSIEKLGKWPFPRKYHALLVKALKSSGAKTIVFDIFFSEKKEDDDELAEAIKSAGDVYLPYVFDLDRDSTDRTMVYASKYAAPLIKELESAAKSSGFINVEPDIDGKIRKIPPFIKYDDVLYPHLTVLAALNNLGVSFNEVKIIPGKSITGKDLVIPLGDDSSMLINYPAKWGKAFRHYSYVDILQSYLSDVTGQASSVDLKELKGSVCFIGLTATASPDAHPSPMEPLYPGVGVHTSVYNSIMKKSFLKRLDKWWNLFILIVMWFITSFVTLKSRRRFAVISILFVMAAYIAFSMVLFWPLGIWIDVFYPLVTITAIYAALTFKKYITEIQKREVIEKELNIARDIQRSFLPREIPCVGDIKLSAKMLTARQVGGDLYDIVKLSDKKIGVMMGDVSGKGVPAALYMAKVVSVFKTFVHEGSASNVVKNVNDHLASESNTNLFVTLTYMIFDLETGSVSFAIGGHLPTILIEPDGKVELLDVTEGMPLGLMEGSFPEEKREYKKGSTFILYTDGVTEAMNTKGEMFEEKRLIELAKTMKGLSAEEVTKKIHKAVSDFAGKAKQHDDITVMTICT